MNDYQTKVYNSLMQKVCVLANDFMPQGHHKFTWNAIDHPTGLYICQIETENHVELIKMILLR